ncbi:MAG TPA: DNA helicase RecQ [Gammaproteobacteria bacterium]
MESEALKVLQSVFGYSEFRGHQEDIIHHLIEGDDVVVLMPTGGGKSLCYQIPSVLRNGVGIIISPLIALMQDQVTSLIQNGVKAAFLNSTLDALSASKIEQQLIDGDLDLLYVAPERLMTGSFQNLLKRIDIALFAIDEAHCVSQWGHDFRREYLQLSVLHETFPEIPRVALTATADEPTRKEIIQRLGLEQAKTFISGFDRPNICYRIAQTGSNAKQDLLQFIRTEHAGHSGIVYCLSRKKVDQIAEWLNDQGLTALPYHAGLSANVRQQNQKRFLNEDNIIIVATIAFGMGIDKPDVRFVAHLNLPKSIEAYYQETGRAGRDGMPADAWMMYGLQDVITLKQMMETSDADETHKRVERHKLDSMLGFSEITSCRRQALLKYFGDHLDQPCGNCDTCLTPVETWDATVVSQKALSCVHRTGQRFGVNYLIDVLLGKDNERIKSFGHDKLSVYGIGKELDDKQWRSIYRQLIARNLLAVDIEGYGALLLTEACRPVLRGEQTLMLRKESFRKTKAKKAGKSKYAIDDGEQKLWDALRDCRRKLAEEQGVPPYVIFHDATLMQMLEHRPENRQQFAQLSGVGERKLEQYADDFLAVINEYVNDTVVEKKSNTVEETLLLFNSGMDVNAIAKHRSLTASTIYTHLAKLIEQKQLDLVTATGLEDKQIKTIENAILANNEDSIKLSKIYESLSGEYDYGVIRCVQAAMLF